MTHIVQCQCWLCACAVFPIALDETASAEKTRFCQPPVRKLFVNVRGQKHHLTEQNMDGSTVAVCREGYGRELVDAAIGLAVHCEAGGADGLPSATQMGQRLAAAMASTFPEGDVQGVLDLQQATCVWCQLRWVRQGA
jgi:hypothetical protein